MTNDVTSELNQPIPSPFASAAREVTVPASRLAWGEWKNGREYGTGDIHESYSADKVPEGKIRKPFPFEGGLWVCVGLSGLHGVNEASAYRLIPEKLFPRPPTTYNIKTQDGDEARADPMGFYDAVAVTVGREKYCLSGPPVRFVAEPERPDSVPEPEQLSLFGAEPR